MLLIILYLKITLRVQLRETFALEEIEENLKILHATLQTISFLTKHNLKEIRKSYVELTLLLTVF